MKQLYFLGLAAAFLAPQISQAKTFANQFVEFQLPDKWECQLDGTEWVCQSTDEQKKRDAIIVLAAKIKKAGMDELPKYKEHLEKPQTYQSLSGENVTSEPRYAKELEISGKTWIDSLHLQSEIPDFYTRYLATVEADLGILVTFSVRKDKYDEYAPDIENMAKSLRAFRKPGEINPAQAGGGDIAAPADTIFGGGGGESKTKPKSSGSESGAALLLLLLIAGGAGFFIWKKKQQKRG
jgi:hypothetical protein